MKKKQNIALNRNFLIIFFLFVFIFSILKIGIVFAVTESFKITNVEIVNKSDTMVNSISYEKNTITNDIIFHKVGDSITYKITVLNNEDDNYTIKSIYDDNENEYITYEYDEYKGVLLNSKKEKEFEIVAKYSKELEDINNRNQNNSVKFTFVLEDANGKNIKEEIIFESGSIGQNISSDNEEVTVAESTNPKTNDNISLFCTTAILSMIMLLMLFRKNNVVRSRKSNSSKGKHYGKKNYKGFKHFSFFLALAIMLPTMSKASGNSFDIIFNSTIKFMDKLVVSYEIDGKTQEMIVNYNDVVDYIETDEKEGYDFKGWIKEDGTQFDFNLPITDDVKIIADYEPITYNISYELNGGKVEENKTTYTVEDEITLNNPEKQGYTFSGWTGSNGDSLQTKVTINKGTIGDKNYLANYSPNPNTKYTVIHKTMDLDGEHYTIRDIDELEGATDTTVKPQTNVYDYFTAPDEEELTIKADGTSVLEYKYTRNKYLLTLNDEDDIETSTLTGEYYYGKEITLKAKDKTGYTFSKWSNDDTNKEITLTITEPLTIEPIYNINSYTITFDSKGGSSVNNITKNYNEEIGTLPTTTKTDKVFMGWYADEEYTTSISENTKVVENTTYYAKWRELNNYTINFNGNGGTVDTDSIIVREGDSVSNLPTPTKTDYIFEGWFTDLTYAIEVTENTIPTEDTTYYAKWRYRFTTVFSFNGVITFNGKNEDLTYDEAAEFEGLVTKNGQKKKVNVAGVPSEFNKGNYIDTNVLLFSETNNGKDFELGFEIVEYDSSIQESQATFVNEKYELSSLNYPGLVVRKYSNTNKIEFTSRTASGWPSKTFSNEGVQKVKIIRKNGILYYCINDGEQEQLQDLNNISEFDTPVTFGASLQTNGTPFRFLKGKLKNLYIILSE